MLLDERGNYVNNSENIKGMFEWLVPRYGWLEPHTVEFLQSLANFYEHRGFLTKKQFRHLAWQYDELSADLGGWDYGIGRD